MSKRLESAAVEQMEAMLGVIAEVVECPVCYQDLSSPIYQCNNGHPVCSRCRVRVRLCPVCKSWLYNVRALTLEKILREMPRLCRFSELGCEVRLAPADRAAHERQCWYRVCRCAESLVPCRWSGPLAALRDHLSSKHQLAGRLHRQLAGRFSFRLSCGGQEKFLEDPTDRLLFRCLVHCERQRLHFLCHALAGDQRAQQYTYSVRVTHGCSPRQLGYQGPVVSVFQTVRRTIDASQCLMVGRDWLLNACRCHQRWLCFCISWNIQRLDPPAGHDSALCRALLTQCVLIQQPSEPAVSPSTTSLAPQSSEHPQTRTVEASTATSEHPSGRQNDAVQGSTAE